MRHFVTAGAVLIGAPVLFDQLMLWAERHAIVYWRKSRGWGKRGGDAGGGMLFLFDELWQPATRHVAEERRSKQMSRMDASTGDDFDLDLTAGTVRLSRRDQPPQRPTSPR